MNSKDMLIIRSSKIIKMKIIDGCIILSGQGEPKNYLDNAKLSEYLSCHSRKTILLYFVFIKYFMI